VVHARKMSMFACAMLEACARKTLGVGAVLGRGYCSKVD
jgi:hypothetical protein